MSCQKKHNLDVCLPNWEWCCDLLVLFIPPRLLTQGADYLVFTLELDLPQNHHSKPRNTAMTCLSAKMPHKKDKGVEDVGKGCRKVGGPVSIRSKHCEKKRPGSQELATGGGKQRGIWSMVGRSCETGTKHQ